MKKIIGIKLGSLFIMVVALTLAVTGMVEAGVDVHVGIFAPPVVVAPDPAPVVVESEPYAPPPAYVVQAAPEVVVIPGTYVYAIPDPRVEIFFYHGYWWRHHDGRWFRAKQYNGSWGHVRNEKVPAAVVRVPHDYHHRIQGEHRIAHRDLTSNWDRWEKDRHWDKREHYDYADRHDRGDGHDREHDRR
jgi:hypothetical protein